MRIKHDIQDGVPGLDFITRLRAVTYYLDVRWQYEILGRGKKNTEEDWPEKYDIEKIKMTGFIAQEVEQAAREAGYDFSGARKAEDDVGMYSISYSQFVVPLVKAIQEQQKTIENQQQRIQDLENQNRQLMQELKQIKIQLHLQ